MTHVLITGITGSGKTHMARAIAKRHANKTQIFYDPTGSFGIEHEPFGDAPKIVMQNPHDFIDTLYLQSTRNLDIYCDEADEIFGKNTEHKWVMQRGRHFGMRVFLISQRPALLDTTSRSQCGMALVFRGNPYDYEAVLPIFGIAAKAKDLNIPMRHYLNLYPSDDSAALLKIQPPIK